MGRDVVDHEVDVEILGHGAIDQIQEAAELDGAVLLAHLGNHVTRSDVEGGVEIGGAPSHVVMCAPLGEPRTQRKHRGGSIQRLDLGLLIDAEHQRCFGRIDVEAHHVTDFLDEERVGAEFEGVRPNGV